MGPSRGIGTRAAAALPLVLCCSLAAGATEPARDATPVAAAPATDPGHEKRVPVTPGFDVVGLDVRPYGRISFDAAWDSARVESGNYASWVASPSIAGVDDSQFSISANASRVGLRVSAPALESVDLSALVEMDFFGGGGENTPNARLRRAEMRIGWPRLDLEIVAGQTWDLVHPLNPAQLNYMVGWFSGNIGYRRPQIQIHKGFALGARSHLSLAAGVSRTLGDPIFPVDVGSDSGAPTGQARVALSVAGLASGPLVVGASGHVGDQECDSLGTDVITWSAGVDASLPLHERVLLQGELWGGQAVCRYLGGIGQGINPDLRRGIRARGGWVALHVEPAPAWEINLGTGVDDPRDADLGAGQRSRNASAWANAGRSFFGGVLQVGLELMWMRTRYVGIESGAAWRLQAQTRLVF